MSNNFYLLIINVYILPSHIFFAIVAQLTARHPHRLPIHPSKPKAIELQRSGK